MNEDVEDFATIDAKRLARDLDALSTKSSHEVLVHIARYIQVLRERSIATHPQSGGRERELSQYIAKNTASMYSVIAVLLGLIPWRVW
jgi:hypothetical protein